MARSGLTNGVRVGMMLLLVAAASANGVAAARLTDHLALPEIAEPFVVVGNLSGEVWLFSLAGDSVGPGMLVHTFQDCMASGLAVVDDGADTDLDIVAMVQPKGAGGVPTGETDIYLLENNGSSFDVSVIPDTIPLSGGFWFPMSDICAEDFLKDGYDDFIVSVTGDFQTVLHLFVYDPVSGAYKQSFLDDTPWATHAWLMDAGDVHEDSFSDFLTFDYPTTSDFADEVYLYSGNGLGDFSPSFACSTIHSVNDIAVGDYNNDGCLDFVVGVDDDGNPGAVWLYLGDRSGFFQLTSETPVFDLDPIHNSGEARTGTGHMDAYDVDQDGNLDVLAFVHGTSSAPYNPSLWFIPGNGDGTFGPPVKVYDGIGDLSVPLALSTPVRFRHRPAALSVDIKPRSCPNPVNVKSRGVLPVAVLGTARLDVTEIDENTILLEGVAPIRTAVEDVARPVGSRRQSPPEMILGGAIDDGGSEYFEKQMHAGSVSERKDAPELRGSVQSVTDSCECTTEGPDGYEDLTMKFETEEIVAALGEVGDRDTLVLTLTARTGDGTELEGWDCIVVLDNEERKAEEQSSSQIQLLEGNSQMHRLSDLHQNQPNPFRKKTTITFSLLKRSHTRLIVQDISGRCVKTLVNRELPPGLHSAVWDSEAPGGLYICRLDAGGLTSARKMLLIR